MTHAAKPRVLIVEDEFLLAAELKDVLAQAGYMVVGPVAKVEDALVLARSAALDVAVLDVRIIGGDSAPVADLLAARGCPFLFASGYAPGDLPRAHRDVPVLTKPLVYVELLAQLAKLVGR